MPTYTVLTPLLTGDGRLEPGDTVDLKVKDARDLLAAGAITKEAPAESEKTSESDQPPAA